MSIRCRSASSALAISLVLVTGVASAARPAAMRAPRSTSARGTAKAKKAAIAAKLTAEKAANEDAAKAPAETDVVGQRLDAQNEARLAAIGSTRAGRIGGAIGNAAMVVFHPIASIKSAAGKAKAYFAKVRENSAARRDFKVWLKREGHEDIKTYHAGARVEANVLTHQVAYVIHSFFQGVHGAGMFISAGAGVLPAYLLNAAGMGLNAGLAMYHAGEAHKGIRTANTRAVEYALDNPNRFVAQSRLERWAKAGVIDTSFLTARKAASEAETAE